MHDGHWAAISAIFLILFFDTGKAMKSNFLQNTDKGMVRAGNQDSYYADPAGRFCIVADGMGGHAGGEEASKIAINTIKNYIEAQWQADSDPRQLLESSLLAANAAILDDQSLNPARSDMGTTLVMLLFEADRVWAANVGDSRLYRFREGNLEQITEDDTWVARAMKMQQLTPEEARVHHLRHVLSHCLGRRELGLRPECIQPIDIRTGDVVLLCSDGLTEEVDDVEIAEKMKSVPLAELPVVLVETAKNNGGSDNITVILGLVEDGDSAAPAAAAAVTDVSIEEVSASGTLDQ
jgi:PPM family protein phosphatase